MNSPDIVNVIHRERIQQPWNLALDQSHIWYIPFNERSIDVKILSPDEILRAKKYKFEIHRDRFMMYRCELRKILSLYYNKNPQELNFGYTKYGKPYILSGLHELQFSLAHSDEMAVLGLAQSFPIGIDVEYMKPFNEMQSIAEQFFAKAEFCKFSLIPEKDKLEAFYNIWTRKEAFVKAVGDGLSYPLDNFTVSFCENELPMIIEINGSENEAMEWTLKSFKLKRNGKNYKIACLIRNKICNIHRYMLSPY